MKREWRKSEKEKYLPKEKPTEVMLEKMQYFTIEGKGNPNDDDFAKRVEVLYAFSYQARMSYKWDSPPKDYSEYTVYPLEGEWDLINPKLYNENGIDKDNLKYKIMIRQPDFVNQDLYEIITRNVREKGNALSDCVKFENIAEGLCVQMLHKGSYDTEPKSFEIMEAYCQDNNIKRKYLWHKEIYLTDPRKTAEEKLKTVLRVRVEK